MHKSSLAPELSATFNLVSDVYKRQVITIADEFDMPVKFIGVGEGIDDLKEFEPAEFAEGITYE